MEDEPQAIVQRIFTRCAQRMGSASALALHLRIPYSELATYISGQAMPPEAVLARAVEAIIEDMPAIRSSFSDAAWRSLPLPPH
jgi:hypothetical protein